MTTSNSRKAKADSRIRKPVLSADELLANLLENGILKASEVQDIENMNKRIRILQVHKAPITQGRGKDTRWFTYIEDPTKANGRKKVGRKTEEELLDYLYELYYNRKDPTMMTLQDIYPEWFVYKKAKIARLNTLHKYDNDYRRFYENDPMSEELMNTPIPLLKKLVIEKWAYSMIHKYNMTRKTYLNMMLPLRQMLDYMIDKEVITTNPARLIHIDKGHFRPERKKPAATQVFFKDEESLVIETARQLAEETKDEVFLAIPLCFRTGLRLGEILGLAFSDFDRRDHTIHVHKSMVTVDTVDNDRHWGQRTYRIEEYLKKNADERFVIVTDDCFALMNEIKLMQMKKGSHSEYLFNVRTPNNLQRKLTKICKRAEIDNRSPHKIRKTYISTLINQMMDLDFVREQVGHKEIQTTLNCYTYSTSRNEKKYRDLSAIFTD